MEPEEGRACANWLRSLVAEAYGPPLPNKPDGVMAYPTDHIRTVLLNHVSPQLTTKVMDSGRPTGPPHWEELTEADLGTIMKAGAARFLMPVVTESP